MSKLGKDFELGHAETILLEKIRSIRGVIVVTLTWKGELKEHMKWMASCTNPKYKVNKYEVNNPLVSIFIAYDSTPLRALKNLAIKLKIDVE